MAAPQTSCYSRGLLHHCHEAIVGVCQYCGRPFCCVHGDIVEQVQEICRRPLCQKKVVDLRAHQSYLVLAGQRNAGQMCGLLDCQRQPWGQCSHCGAVFCRSHVRPRVRTIRREGLPVQEPVSLCDHCWQRHDLWAQA